MASIQLLAEAENENGKLEKELKQAIDYLVTVIVPLRDEGYAQHSGEFINSVCEFIDKYYHKREPLEFKDTENETI